MDFFRQHLAARGDRLSHLCGGTCRSSPRVLAPRLSEPASWWLLAFREWMPSPSAWRARQGVCLQHWLATGLLHHIVIPSETSTEGVEWQSFLPRSPARLRLRLRFQSRLPPGARSLTVTPTASAPRARQLVPDLLLSRKSPPPSIRASGMWRVSEGDQAYFYAGGNGYTHSDPLGVNPNDRHTYHHAHGPGHHDGHHHHGHGHHGHQHHAHPLSAGHHHSGGFFHRLRGLLGHHSHDHGAHGWGHHSYDPYAPYSAGAGYPVVGGAAVVELRVEMTSERSRKVIMKKLSKLHGVMNVDVDIQNQKVTVVGNVSPDEVLKKVRKTGRKAHLWMGQVVQSTEYSGAPAAGYSSVGGYASAPVTTMY